MHLQKENEMKDVIQGYLVHYSNRKLALMPLIVKHDSKSYGRREDGYKIIRNDVDMFTDTCRSWNMRLDHNFVIGPM